MQDRSRFLTIIVLLILGLVFMLWGGLRARLIFEMMSFMFILLAGFYAVTGYFSHKTENIPPSLKNQTSRKQLLDNLSRSLSVPFMILSGSGRVTFMSDAFVTMFPTLKIGDHYSKLARAPIFVNAMNAAMEGQEIEPFFFEIFRDIERAYEVAVINLDSSVMSGIEGDVLVEIFDRTDERSADRMRRDFIANSSHELRTPLAGIIGGIETMRANNDQETIAHFLPMMGKEAARMQRLIDDLMALSRVEMNEHDPPETVVNFRDVLEDCLNVLGLNDDFEAVQIDNQYQADDQLYADADQLQQILINILDNAAKYAGKNAKITIERVDYDPRYPRKFGVKITDNGPGIEAKDIARLTERFYRVSKVASRDKGGTGLGLAIVKHMLRRHRGELQIQSRIGEGSAFTIWLPMLE